MAISTTEDEDRTSKFAAVLKNSGTAGLNSPPPKRQRRRVPRWTVLGVIVLVVVGFATASVKSTLLSSSAPAQSVLTEKVRRADLVVSIAEDGNVESAHNKDVKCELQGGGTILWLIPDGAMAQKGDELVRLDS